jgi:hypothetical protein
LMSRVAGLSNRDSTVDDLSFPLLFPCSLSKDDFWLCCLRLLFALLVVAVASRVKDASSGEE